MIVEDVAIFIAGIMVVARLKCVWSVNEIKIEILETKSIQTPLESRFDAFGTVIGVPQLCSNKNVFACDPASGKSCLQRHAYLALVSISFRAIEMSKAGF